MAYKSEKQRRYLNAAAARGEVPKVVVEEFNRKSKGRSLPEIVRKSKPKKGR